MSSDYSSYPPPPPTRETPPAVGGETTPVIPTSTKGGLKKREVKFSDSFNPKDYLDFKAQKEARRVFRKSLPLASTAEVGIRTLEHFITILNTKDLDHIDRQNLIRNANKICEYLAKNASFNSGQIQRIYTLSSENPGLTGLGTILEYDKCVGAQREWSNKIRPFYQALLDLDIPSISLSEKQQLRAKVHSIDTLISQYQINQYRTSQYRPLGPNEETLINNIKKAREDIVKFKPHIKELIDPFEAQQNYFMNQILILRGERLQPRAILQLQNNYQKLSPLFLVLKEAEGVDLERRYRTIVSKFKKADIDELGTEWQEIVRVLNNPINQQDNPELYNEKLFLLNDFLHFTYVEATDDQSNRQRRDRQLEILTRIIGIMQQPENAALKRAIESFSDKSSSFKRLRTIQYMDLSVIESIRSEQLRINRIEVYNNYSKLKETTPVAAMSMETPPPELIDYLQAIGEACKEGITFTKGYNHQIKVKEIIEHFGKQFVCQYIDTQYVNRFFQE